MQSHEPRQFRPQLNARVLGTSKIAPGNWPRDFIWLRSLLQWSVSHEVEGDDMWRLIFIIAGVSLHLSANAEVLQVPSNAFPNIAAAIQASAPGDEIVVSPGTYIEGGLQCPHGLTLRSSTPEELVVIDAQGHAYGLWIDVEFADAYMADIEFRGGESGLVVIGQDLDLETTISRCQFVENSADGVAGTRGRTHFDNCRMESNGGSGWAWESGEVSMNNCVIDGNGDSGVWSLGVSLIIEDTSIRNNSAEDGGGMMLIAGSGEFREVVVANNEATDAGGGVLLSSAGTFYFDDCTITDCSATRGAHGFFGHVDGSSIDGVFNCCDVDTTQFAGESWDQGMITITFDGCAVPLQGRTWSEVKNAFR